MRTLIAATVSLPLLLSPAFANATTPSARMPSIRTAVLAQASPSPAQPSPQGPSPTASPSPGAEDDRGGIGTGAGLVIAAVLLGGLLLMRSRLLRR